MSAAPLLWIPHASWSVPQRARLLSESLVGVCDVHSVDFFQGSTNLRGYLSGRYIKSYFPSTELHNGVNVHHVPQISPSLYLHWIRSVNQSLMSNAVREIIQNYAIENVVGCFIVPPPECSNLIFDIFDPNPEYWRSSSRFAHEYADEIAQMEARYLQRANRVTAASTILAMTYGVEDRAEVIPNGINLQAYSTAARDAMRERLGLKSRLVLVYSGRLEHIQEATLLLDSFRIVRRSMDVVLMVIGGGFGYDWLRKASSQEPELDIRFLGPVEPADMPAYLAAADIGLCPYSEARSTWIPYGVLNELRAMDTPVIGGSMKIVEYSASGLPVVCTDQAAFNKIGFENVIFSGFSADSYAKSIRIAADSPRRRPSLISEYDLSNLIRKFQEVLK